MDSPRPAITPPPLPTAELAVGMVDSDRGCIKCSYNLRGLPMGGVCPECGTPVQDSLRGIMLQYAGPEYLATIRRGLSFVLNGILLMIVTTVGMIVFAIAMSSVAGVSASTGIWQVISGIVQLGVTALILAGYWLYTQPDPGFIGSDLPDTARKIVRYAVQVQAASAVVETFLLLFIATSGGPTALGMILSLLSGAASLVGFVAWIVGFFGIMRYTQWMARRIPDQHIVNRCATYTWLLPVIAVVGLLAIGLGPLIALVLYWNLLDRMRKHLESILARGLPAPLPGSVI